MWWRNRLKFGRLGDGLQPPYVAQAVHFDGVTWLSTVSTLGAVDGPLGILSFWCKQAESGDLMNFDIPNNQPSGCLVDTGNGLCPIQFGDSITPNPDTVGWLFSNQAFSSYLYDDTADQVLVPQVWNHFLLSWNLGFNAGSRRFAIYQNDIKITSFRGGGDIGSSIDNAYSDDGFFVGTFGGSNPTNKGMIGDLCDVNFISTATIVEADNTISTANRRKFIDADGKPVNPGTTGLVSLFCLSGDSDTFADNIADTGAFTVTGTLTNASTSPSD